MWFYSYYRIHISEKGVIYGMEICGKNENEPMSNTFLKYTYFE